MHRTRLSQALNIIERLMVEHLVLRQRFRFIKESGNSNSIYELEDFVRKYHARVEDELVFPRLRSVQEASQNLSRLEADHKLIDKIGDQIKTQTEEGNIEVLKKRIALYMSTVESHNLSEESLIFPYWKMLGISEISKEIESKARKMTEEFGLARYFTITEMSQKLFEGFD